MSCNLARNGFGESIAALQAEMRTVRENILDHIPPILSRDEAYQPGLNLPNDKSGTCRSHEGPGTHALRYYGARQDGATHT